MPCNSLKNSLHVMQWNAQGITTDSAVTQLEQFLHREKIDILLLNETFLKPHHNFRIGNYKVYREDRQTHGGGVLIAILKTIEHTIIPRYSTIDIENISILVKINGRQTIFTAAYSPHYTNQFRNDISILTNTANDFFVFGDLNAQHKSWNCTSNNQAGNVLYRLQIHSNFYVYFPPMHTRFGQNSHQVQPSTVDVLLSNSSLPISTLRTWPNELTSDHVPVSFHIFGAVICKDIKIKLYNQANWSHIRTWVENEVTNRNIASANITIQNIDNVLNNVSDVLKKAHDLVPTGKKAYWFRKISPLSKYLIGQRNKYKRKIQRCSDMHGKAQLKSIISQLNNLIDFHLNKDRNENFSCFVSKFTTGSKKFWHVSKAFRSNSKKNAVPDLSSNNGTIKTDKEKANILADVFEGNNSTTLNDTSPMDRKVGSYTRTLSATHISDDEEIPLTDLAEVLTLTSLQKNSKAPGIDGIPSILLKNMPNVFFQILVNVFNFCLRSGYFPHSFKIAKVIPIHKKGKDTHLPSSYRPISMLNIVDKIFENILLKRIKIFTEENNIINDEPFGFRKQHSTVHQLKRVVNFIEKNKQLRKSTGVVFLDIEKAFDSIWHEGLLYKMNTFGFPFYIQKILKSFLTQRSFVVSINNCLSSPRNIPAGLPQGSVLSPLLYSIFTADFVVSRNQEAAFYADDSALICSGKVSDAIVKKLKNSLTSASRYFSKWKIRINQEKTQAILFPFNKSPKRRPTMPLIFDGTIINMQDDIKYLGLILDKKLTFKRHIEYVCEKAIKCGRGLYPLLNRRSFLNKRNKLLLYNMCILPILSYAGPVWYGKAAKTYTKKLQIIQNKNLKIIHKLRWRYPTTRLHSEFQHKTVDAHLADQSSSFLERCRISNHDIIRNLVE